MLGFVYLANLYCTVLYLNLFICSWAIMALCINKVSVSVSKDILKCVNENADGGTEYRQDRAYCITLVFGVFFIWRH